MAANKHLYLSPFFPQPGGSAAEESVKKEETVKPSATDARCFLFSHRDHQKGG